MQTLQNCTKHKSVNPKLDNNNNVKNVNMCIAPLSHWTIQTREKWASIPGFGSIPGWFQSIGYFWRIDTSYGYLKKKKNLQKCILAVIVATLRLSDSSVSHQVRQEDKGFWLRITCHCVLWNVMYRKCAWYRYLVSILAVTQEETLARTGISLEKKSDIGHPWLERYINK